MTMGHFFQVFRPKRIQSAMSARETYPSKLIPHQEIKPSENRSPIKIPNAAGLKIGIPLWMRKNLEKIATKVATKGKTRSFGARK